MLGCLEGGAAVPRPRWRHGERRRRHCLGTVRRGAGGIGGEREKGHGAARAEAEAEAARLGRRQPIWERYFFL